MTLTVDLQVAAILAPMAQAMADAPHPAIGDIGTRRATLEAMMAQTAALQPTPTDVTITDLYAIADDGAKSCCAGTSRMVLRPDRRPRICTAGA